LVFPSERRPDAFQRIFGEALALCG
jgi:hypothetical protein